MPPGTVTFPRDRLAGSTLEAAAALLGALLVREGDGTGDAGGPVAPRVARIVEVEAYLGPEDRASHARFGRTARTWPMFGPPGVAYVYLVYGMYDCLNVVTGPDGRAGAVLIRAAEPVAGQAEMRAARAGHRARRTGGEETAPRSPGVAIPDHRLAAGPGLVAAALSVDRGCSGLDLCDPSSPLRLELTRAPGKVIRPVAGPRIGVAHAGEPWASAPYRLLDPTSLALSGGAPPTGTPRPDGARGAGR